MLHENEIKALFFEKVQSDAPDRFKTMRVYRIPVMIAGVAQWAVVKDNNVLFKDTHDNVKPIIMINKGEIEERVKASAANVKKNSKQKPVKPVKQKPVKPSKQKQESEADVISTEDVLDPGESSVKKKKHIIFPIFVVATIVLSFCFRINDIPLFNLDFLKYGIFGKLSFILLCIDVLLNVIAFIATIAGNVNKDVTKPNKLGSKVLLWFLGLLCLAGSVLCAVKSILDFMSVISGGVQ